MAKKGIVQDEVRVSRVVLMMGNASILVTCALGTRDENRQFTWSEKKELQVWPEGVTPLDEAGNPTKDAITVPKSVIQELREFMIALEDSLQHLVDEPVEAVPATMAEIKARKYTDPRVEPGWDTIDGHNPRGTIAVPTPTERRISK